MFTKRFGTQRVFDLPVPLNEPLNSTALVGGTAESKTNLRREIKLNKFGQQIKIRLTLQLYFLAGRRKFWVNEFTDFLH